MSVEIQRKLSEILKKRQRDGRFSDLPRAPDENHPFLEIGTRKAIEIPFAHRE